MYLRGQNNMQIKNHQRAAIKLSENDCLENLMEQNFMPKSEVFEINHKKSFTENDLVLLPEAYKNVYIVKPLDTIESISKRLNVDTKTIVCATNGKIFVGQKIFL